MPDGRETASRSHEYRQFGEEAFGNAVNGAGRANDLPGHTWDQRRASLDPFALIRTGRGSTRSAGLATSPH